MESYRFNVIRWSATNLRKPSLWKRAGLFFNTGGIPGILRENFRQNRADLLARWERGVIGDINRSLIRLGSIPLSSKPRDLSRQLKDISRKIYRMTTYDRCPSLLQESLLLSTYEYIFASPHDRKFGKLCPDRTVSRRKASATRTTRASSPEGRRSFTSLPPTGKPPCISSRWTM